MSKLPDWILELERLANEATPGPWEQGDVERGRENVIMAPGYWWSWGHLPAGLPPQDLKDAAFIAASRAAVPRLIEALKEAISVLDTISMPVNQVGDWQALALAQMQGAREALDKIRGMK